MKGIEVEPEEERLTPAMLFTYAGVIDRSNYKRTWVGCDYRMQCGKHKGKLLSQVNAPKYLLWLLNNFDGELEADLYSAIKDQYNAQFS